MDRHKIISHAYFRSGNAHAIAPLFKHVVGVLTTYTGNLKSSGAPFLHLAFDELSVTYEKLATLYICTARSAKDREVGLIVGSSGEADIDAFLSEKVDKHKLPALKKESGLEFINHFEEKGEHEDIELHIAYSSEATAHVATHEGAIRQLESTKRAMLNLLEDSREAENKILAQAEALAKTLEESQRFAKTAEEERKNYLLLISSIGEGVVVLSPNRTVEIANNAALILLGAGREELSGKDPMVAIDLRERGGRKLGIEFWDSIMHTVKTQKIPPVEIVRKDGSVIIVSSVIAPVNAIGTKGNTGIIITFRDIGEEVALEDARINFISTASHQLRTPLTSMRWFSEMLLNGEAGEMNDEQKQFISQITFGVDRMINLVNYLLRTGRVESSRVKITPEPIKIKAILERCVQHIADALTKRSQTVNISGDDIPEIALDQHYVDEVFTNILNNASLYGKDKDNIIVETRLRGNIAYISITDHGIGISPEDQNRLFNKFFRSEQSIIASPDGSGLGLSFVKSLVADWGGDITVKSKESEGSTFTVTIPLKGMTAREGEVRLTE